MIIRQKIAKYANIEGSGFQKFLLLFIIGFLMIFAGITILIITAVLSGGSVNFGAIVFIGPIPLIVGVGPEATLIILLATILAVLSIIIFLTSRRKVRISS